MVDMDFNKNYLLDDIDIFNDIGFFVYDIDTKKLTFSKGFCNILSIESSEFTISLNEYIDKFVYYADANLFYKIDKIESPIKFRCRLIDSLGYLKLLYFSISPQYDDKNKIIKMDGCIRDLSEKMHLKIESSFTEKIFTEILDKSYQIVYSMNEDGYFTYCSSNVTKYLGYELSDVIGKHQKIFTDELTNDKLYKVREKVKNTGIPQELVNYKLKHKDGSLSWNTTTFFYYKDPYLDEGTFWAVMKDITTTKMIEEKLDENDKKLKESREYERIKNEFIANISHELRTPVNIIYSSLQLFDLYIDKNDFYNTKDKFIYYSKVMKQNCYRLLRLINNLIECSSLNAGVSNLETTNFDIVSLTLSICNSVKPHFKNHNLSFSIMPFVSSAIINGNVDKIELILLNLLSNSIKFSKPNGHIIVSIYEDDNYILISVKDDGIGISEDKLPIIFDRFTQGQALLTRSNEGSGVGLSIVKSLVEMHNGSISVNSKKDIGTEFIIKFPIIAFNSHNLSKLDNVIHLNHEKKVNIEFSDIYDE